MTQLAAVEHREVAPVPMQDMLRMAEAFAKSGFFGIKTADQALALMAIAQAEGLHPAIAARDYHVIQGKPALKADAMLARFQSAGGRVKWTAMTDERVCAEFSHPAGGTVEIDWDKARANQAGFWGKDNWKKFPRAMLRARVISEGIRTVFPGVVVGTYTPEEVQDFDATVKTVESREVVQELPPEYSSDDFDKNFPKWEAAVKAGKKSPAGVIKMIESAYILTPDQINQIKAIGQESAQ